LEKRRGKKKEERGRGSVTATEKAWESGEDGREGGTRRVLLGSEEKREEEKREVLLS
jgi:hypothetical protein